MYQLGSLNRYAYYSRLASFTEIVSLLMLLMTLTVTHCASPRGSPAMVPLDQWIGLNKESIFLLL